MIDRMRFGSATSFLPYGDFWRKHRTIYNRQMNPGAIEQFQGLQIQYTGRLLKALKEDPGNFRHHIRTWVVIFYPFMVVSRYSSMAASIVLGFAYGYEDQYERERYGRIAQQVILAFSKGSKPGAFLVDHIPWCKSCFVVNAFIYLMNILFSKICSCLDPWC